jgi:hypothetical protein
MPITLTTGKQVSVNGVQQENDTQGAAITLHMDWTMNVGTLNFSIGSGAPSAFTVGVYDQPVQLVVNMTTGAWSTSIGTSGVFSGAGFTSFQNQFKAIRNAAETFAASQFMPGVQVPWT